MKRALGVTRGLEIMRGNMSQELGKILVAENVRRLDGSLQGRGQCGDSGADNAGSEGGVEAILSEQEYSSGEEVPSIDSIKQQLSDLRDSINLFFAKGS